MAFYCYGHFIYLVYSRRRNRVTFSSETQLATTMYIFCICSMASPSLLLDLLIRLNQAVRDNPSNLETLQECIDPSPDISDDVLQVAIECARGCYRFSKFLETTVSHFFKHSLGETASRKDSHLYRAITYIVIFQFAKIGLDQFTQMIRTQSPRNMYYFLSYLLNQENIQTWLYQEWCKSYDTEFVDKNICQPLLSISKQLCDYLQILNDKIDSKQVPKLPSLAKIPNTQTIPFNLTQAKPKQLPELEEVSIKLHYKPVDPKIYQAPEEATQIERAKEANKKNAEKKLMDAQKKRPRCATMEKSDKTKAKIQEIVDERDSVFKESRTRKAKPYLPPKADDSLVKKNAASVLREGVLFQREEQRRAQELLELEAGGRDAGEYYRWQGAVLTDQLEREQLEVEKKHLMGRITYEEAIIAKQTLGEENKALVERLKEQRQRLLEEYFRDREEERKRMQRLVEEIAAGKENAKLAQENLKEMKRKIVAEVSRENQAMMQAAIEMAQAEMERKMEMIQQIRAMERVPIIRAQFFDMTETGGHGLLSEMSVAELNERLDLMKVAMLDEEEARRSEINLGKKERHDMIESTVDFIREARSNQQRESSIITKTVQSLQASRKAQSNPEVLALKEKLQARHNLRKEKTRDIVASPKQSDKKRTFLGPMSVTTQAVFASL